MQEDQEPDDIATINVDVKLCNLLGIAIVQTQLAMPIWATLADTIAAAWTRQIDHAQTDMDLVRRWHFSVYKRCRKQHHGHALYFLELKWAMPYLSQRLTALRAVLDVDSLSLVIEPRLTQDETLLAHLLAHQRRCDDATYRALCRLTEAQLWHGVSRQNRLRSPPVYKPRSEAFHWSCMQFHWQRWGRQHMTLRYGAWPDLPGDVQTLVAHWLAYLLT
jgi:hypothetical protein